jgi:glycosyltransferase involved in cell wall biosynthesis
MTSIPPRAAFLERKIESIKNQTLKPDGFEIYIPKRYRRFPDQSFRVKGLPDWVNVVTVDEDLGPATKILPACKKWAGHDVDLLLCDDDRLHDDDWIKRLSGQRTKHPNDIICERGWNVSQKYSYVTENSPQPRAKLSGSRGRTFSYRLKRMLSLGLAHPPRTIYEEPGYVDVFEGFLGALVPVSAFDERVFDIPEAAWMVDDVWLSAMAAAKGTGIWAHSEPRPVFSNTNRDKFHALTTYTEDGIGRREAEIKCIEIAREKFGVWK